MTKIRTSLFVHLKVLSNQEGVTLIEVLLVVMAVGFLTLLISSIPASVSSINVNRHISTAKDIASKEIDYLRKQTYANLSNGSNSFADPALNDLPQSSASYNIEDCSPPICGAGERVKNVTVEVKWTEGGKNQSVNIATMIGEGGIGQ